MYAKGIVVLIFSQAQDKRYFQLGDCPRKGREVSDRKLLLSNGKTTRSSLFFYGFFWKLSIQSKFLKLFSVTLPLWKYLWV